MMKTQKYNLVVEISCIFLVLLAVLPQYVTAQINIPNPLIKPVKAGRPIAEGGGQTSADPKAKLTQSPPLPEGRSSEPTVEKASSEKSISPQENFNLQQQVLNSEKIPGPLRIVLSTLSVTAIVGDLAILRQQLNLNNLAVQGGAAAGQANLGANGGVSSVIGGGLSSPSPATPPAGQPGVTSVASATRLFSVRVKNKKPTYISGHEVTPVVNDGVVSLYWRTPNGNDLLVFNGNVETANAGAYVPTPVVLERRDYNSYDRLIPNSTGSSNGSLGLAAPSGAQGATGAGTGGGGAR